MGFLITGSFLVEKSSASITRHTFKCDGYNRVMNAMNPVRSLWQKNLI